MLSTNQELVDYLIKRKVLKSKRIIEAFLFADRKKFVPKKYASLAYIDTALPIQSGQTISQPFTVAFMLELLKPHLGDNALDVGSGSGWTSALMGYLVGDKGSVTGLERIASLARYGRHNIDKFNLSNTKIYHNQHGFGPEKLNYYRKILVSASGNMIESPLIAKLKIGGVMVAPIVNDIVKVKKQKNSKLTISRYPGFVFVPLIT